MIAGPDLDGEQGTHGEESVAISERSDAESQRGLTEGRDSGSSRPSWTPLVVAPRSMAESLVSALSTGQIGAVSGAASLRRRTRGGGAFEQPRSMLSQNGAPTRVVAMSSLRRLLRGR